MTQLRIISLGAGVQSTAMALMAAHGEITPMPDCAIFADTQWEPKAVYEHLEWLMSPNVLPFPVHIVTAGNIREDVIARSNTAGVRYAAVPWFTKETIPAGSEVEVVDVDEGRTTRILDRDKVIEGMGRRQCTKEYKLRPAQKKVVELMGGKRPKGGAEVWIGISLDEVIRVNSSRVQYIVNRHPLVEKRLRRGDCIEWMRRHGYPEPPRSACIGCPFRKNEEWRRLNEEEFADAVEVDKAIRKQPGFRGEQYAHRSLVPLNEADISSLEDQGQLNMFNNECEGMCGV